MTDPSPTIGAQLNSPLTTGANLRLGVTGHRQFHDPSLICEKIHEVLAELDRWFDGNPYTIEVLSELADGADRLVPQCIQARTSAKAAPVAQGLPPTNFMLRAVLPMQENVYCGTFLPDATGKSSGNSAITANRTSVNEFQEFVRQAASTIIAPLPKDTLGHDPAEIYKNSGHRHDAYRWAGEYIVDHCDILLAIWDGTNTSRPGSTAQVLKYARQVGRSIVCIHANSGKISWQVSGDDLAAQYYYFQRYDQELRTVEMDQAQIDRRFAQLVDEAERAGLSTHEFPAIRATLLPRFLQARTLAARYQSRYYWCGRIGYACAAASVCVATLTSMVLPKNWQPLFLLEAVLIFVAGMSGWLLKNKGWQREWIDYRYLAERLRASCFLYIAGIPFEPAPSYPDTSFDWLPDGWVSLALRKAWNALPPPRPDHERFRDPAQIRALAAFLYRGWIHHQQLYYCEASEANKRRSEWYENISFVLLAVTFVIALAYGLSAFFGEKIENPLEWFGEWPHVAAGAFPAITSALAGIMVFRHFARNAERYTSMDHFLDGVGKRILAAVGLQANEDQIPDLQLVRALVQDADRAMAHEHEGWRTVFGVRLPGPG